MGAKRNETPKGYPQGQRLHARRTGLRTGRGGRSGKGAKARALRWRQALKALAPWETGRPKAVLLWDWR